MPQNCSADVQAVIAHFDAIANDKPAFDALKAQFGMEEITHPDDVTGARESLLRSFVIRPVYNAYA